MKLPINQRYNRHQAAQVIVVLLCALALKLYYSTAGVNQLRWILAPTTAVVEFVTGLQFKFESHAGYISSDRTFVIAASCAGVNFLITAFLMLSLRTLWQNGVRNQPIKLAWRVIPQALFFAYIATLLANTIRISTALRLRQSSFEIAGLSPNQLHRLEGIVIYFGCLLLLFVLSERLTSKTRWLRKGASDSNAAANSKKAGDLLRQSLLPLLVYYATTLGLPLANGAYRQGRDFWEHSAFVLVTPFMLILPLAAFRMVRNQRAVVRANSGVRTLLSDGPSKGQIL
jgi:exosortase K